MKFRSRILTVLLCILALVCSMFVFTACGDNTNDNGNNNGNNNGVVDDNNNNDNNDDNDDNGEQPGGDQPGGDQPGGDQPGEPDEPEAPEHVHNNFIYCSDCGKYVLVDEKDVELYENVLTDVFSKNFAVVVENFEVSMTMEGDTVDAGVDVGELVIKMDDNDNITAYGKGIVTIDTDYTESVTLDATVVIDSEYLYVKVDGTTPFDSMSTFNGTYMMVPLETVTASVEEEMDMESVSGMLDAYYQMGMAWYNDGGKELVDQFLNTSEPYAKAIATYMLNSMFKKVETADGIVLSFSLEGLKKANDYLYNTTLEEILTDIVGEDPITTLRAKAGELVVITLGEFITKVEADAGKDIYQIIDDAWATFGSLIGPIAGVGEEDIEEVKSYIAQASFRQMSIKSVVEMMINMDEEGNPVPVEEYVTIEMLLDQAVVMFNEYKDLTIYDLVGMFLMPSVSPEGNLNPNPFDASAEEPDMLAMIKDLADTVITMYDDAFGLDIYLNNKNEVTSVKYSVIYNMDEMVARLPGFIVDMMEGVEEVDQNINAVIALDPAYTSEINYGEIVAEVKELFDNIDVTAKDVYDFLVSIEAPEYYENYNIEFNAVDGTTTICYETYDYDNSSDHEYDSENETVTKTVEEHLNIYSETYSPNLVTVYKDCGDWYRILIPYTASETKLVRVYTVVANFNGEILSKELVEEYEDKWDGGYEYTTNTEVFYNLKTKELRGGEQLTSEYEANWGLTYSYAISMHDFEILAAKTVIPVNCGDRGQKVYVCKDCGFTLRHHWTKEHDTEYVYSYENGQDACGTVYVKQTCKECHKVVHAYDYEGHNTHNVLLNGPVAADVYMNICPCGGYVDSYLSGDVYCETTYELDGYYVREYRPYNTELADEVYLLYEAYDYYEGDYVAKIEMISDSVTTILWER